MFRKAKIMMKSHVGVIVTKWTYNRRNE